MVSHQTFIVLAYIFCALGIIGALNTIATASIGSHHAGQNDGANRVSSVVNGLAALVFAGVLLFGLIKRRAEYIRAYILYMKIHFGILVVLIIILNVIVVIFAASAGGQDEHNKDAALGAIGIVLLITGIILLVITAFFFFFLWIVKGALRAVESENSNRRYEAASTGKGNI
ncbi:uncharacterized protein LOC129743097 isoform X1 [Uranotaenia lowii]|uniref:uncharacterized protein LOC129739601 n=1 Tax=Uranotaenia lowii TaxID=190385 RepID=UPI0024799607|nr:uncharacterized protein LOC129739601 [Uranotaenia lowii]XP_055591031.1 uncharacterized protein LOC129743097 isoform X1 [Uranotaenia lowii]